MHGVFEFPHVTRPVIVNQCAHGRLRDLGHRLLEFVAKDLQEMESQRRDIVAALPQRRGVNREHVDPIVKILTERAIRNHRLEVLVGGRNQSDIGLLDDGAANRPEFALLNHAQQFGLR